MNHSGQVGGAKLWQTFPSDLITSQAYPHCFTDNQSRVEKDGLGRLSGQPGSLADLPAP